MPFLGLKTGSAEQELCPLFGRKDAPGAKYACKRGHWRDNKYPATRGSVIERTNFNLIWILPMSTNTTQQRISFSTVKTGFPILDLLEVQLKSFRDFFQMDTTAENSQERGSHSVFQGEFPNYGYQKQFLLRSLSTTTSIRPVTRSRSAWSARSGRTACPLKAKLKPPLHRYGARRFRCRRSGRLFR